MSTVVIRPLGRGECEIVHSPSGAQLRSSKSAQFGGLGTSFSSTDLLSAALGSCIATDLEPVAERNGLAPDAIRIEVDKRMTLTPKRIEAMRVTITVPPSVDDTLFLKLERAAQHCLVQRSLSPDVHCAVAVLRAEEATA
jgi:uncharacterized OsmC-like protein